ncbi:fungal-specific transcription factor domain-containing protein [Xylaria digitata]|nr:fungal-specific transcription factor domain-containing protein [Xylaria digitata]
MRLLLAAHSPRQACDLCFKKKIRCDGLRPTCSNCSLYKVSCRTTSIRKKASSNKQPSIATVESSTAETKRDDSLDARLARIEAKLDALQGASSTISLDQLFEEGTSNEGVLGIPLNYDMTRVSSSADWISPRSPDGPPVPPLTEVLPVVESFFQDYNSLIPLFNQQSFMRLIDDYYKPHGEKPRIYAGVINVVLAMGYRVQSSHHGDAHDGFNDIKIKTCVDNAKIMLDELMTRTQDTLGLQALLGLVILYQTSADQTASSVLISAAMRLAHSLRLDSKSAHSELSPQEARQRANIFWVGYMLDKDISLRTITPSSQIDSDIDIDLPSLASEDYGSLLYTLDGRSQFHLFRAKIQLAHLEGRVYDSLLSNRSRKLSHEARGQAVAQIDRLMERWERSIPPPFRPENMTGNLLSGPLVHMTSLYQTYLMCLTMMHGPYSHDSPWLKSLGGLGSGLLRTFNPRGDVSVDHSPCSNPSIWGKCVTTSRVMLNILSYQ